MNQNSNFDKVIIKAFADNEFQQEKVVYTLPVNPKTYSKKHKVEHESTQGIGNEGNNSEYKNTKAPDLTMEFIFDGTNTIRGYGKPDVSVGEQVEEFKRVVYNMEGDIHQPKFLKIGWGDLPVFDCKLSTMDIAYTLFNRDGEPLRATVKVSFVEYCNNELRTKKEGKNSPDLTHVRTVTEGDKLPLMTYRIYDEDAYYLEVARVNNLTSFRNLKAGQEIIFPSVEKNIANE